MYQRLEVVEALAADLILDSSKYNCGVKTVWFDACGPTAASV